jgi:hypothetical protein
MLIDGPSIVVKGQKSMATKWSVQLRCLLQFIGDSKTMSNSDSGVRNESRDSAILDSTRYHFAIA